MGSFSGWGTVDFRSLEGEGYDGNASAFFLGVDVKVSPYVLLGAAVGHNRSETDYTYGSATQTLETTVTSVLPYVSYKPNPRAIVWGVVGRGGGEATTTVHNATDSESSDLTMNLGMFGASARFASRGATQFGIRGDAAFASLATEDGNGAADGLDAGVNRLRIGAEAMHVYGMADGSTVTPYGEINLRYDGGDGVTGSGIELAGGVRIMTNAFSLDARGHTVAAHSAEDFSESGVTLMATLNPSHGNDGLVDVARTELGSNLEAAKPRVGRFRSGLSAVQYRIQITQRVRHECEHRLRLPDQPRSPCVDALPRVRRRRRAEPLNTLGHGSQATNHVILAV